MIGGVVGFGVLMAVAGGAGPNSGCTSPRIPPLAAAGMEALLTGSLALLLCGLWAAHDDARPDTTAPIKAGLAIAGLVYAGVSPRPSREPPPTAFQQLRVYTSSSHIATYQMNK